MMIQRKTIALGIFVIFSGCMGLASAASFDCKIAKTQTEKAICQHQNLSDADIRMVTVYNIVLHALPMGGRDAEKSAQYQWLKQRNLCHANTQCIQKAYQKRQVQLDQIINNRVLSQGPF